MNASKGDFIEVDSEYMYNVLLIDRVISENKFEGTYVYQSNDGLDTYVVEEFIVDINRWKEDNKKDWIKMKSENKYRFLRWILENIFTQNSNRVKMMS